MKDALTGAGYAGFNERSNRILGKTHEFSC
jgi:hypothetical protein